MPRSHVASLATDPATQSPEELSAAITSFLEQNHPEAVVREEGEVLFVLARARWTLCTEHGRCTLHLWSEERNLVRRVLAAKFRNSALQLSTQRFGQAQPKLLELCAGQSYRAPAGREAERTLYLKLLERVLAREFAPGKPEGFRTAMDLERSFGPAYARGSLVSGREAWAVIGVGAQESANTIDGVLTLGILWLHECRARAAGRRLYKGLRVVVPHGQATLTHARMPWLNAEAAQWELLELNESEETLTARDAADQGNLRTALVHRPDETRALERFSTAVQAVEELVPPGEWERVEQHLRSGTELVFLLHGLQFARAHVVLEEASFRHHIEVTVGAGTAECALNASTREPAAAHIADLFRRRQAHPAAMDYGRRGLPARDRGQERRIGSGVLGAAHRRTLPDQRHLREALRPTQDPLFRASPERWLESVLRADLAPLTRNLAPKVQPATYSERRSVDYADDSETRGNRADAPATSSCALTPGKLGENGKLTSRLIPRLDPRHVYTQVPAIAGASDRGLLDLLGVTEEGRLAVIELKTEDDLHFALQGLDYWIRVREHHAASADHATGLGEFQRHGYFTDVELSPHPPRLYLVAPALHIHPATETVLRYLSPQVEWHLLALDERWRQAVRVLWRKSNVRS